VKIRLRDAFLALVIACTGCASLPPLEGRPESHALPAAKTTALDHAVGQLVSDHPGLTGIHALAIATDAFAARVLLAQAAERSIDAQYYIWHDDQTGRLLLSALRDAARRGVRVRLLIDDQNTKGFDETLAAMAAEANVELRLYNPFPVRRGRAFAYLTEFSRLNRRMHNKVFIADNQAAIIGGRNIGNEYFGAQSDVPFLDLDVLAIGTAVAESSAQFDLYWNSQSAYPVPALFPPASSTDREALDVALAGARNDEASKAYVDAVRETPLRGQLQERKLAFEWAPARLVRDDPAKTLADEPRPEHLALTEMMDIAGPARKSLELISPYFVPGERGTAALVRLAKSGVQVRILTNSLSSTDVSVVHSGYAKRRCDLARAGVTLYELKAAAIDLRGAAKSKSTPGSSSGSSLHAKTFAVDAQRVFVGSFNFDPRSAFLNTEMGLIIDSPVLATRLAGVFDRFVRGNAYEVRAIPGDACIEWIDHRPGGEVTFASEPEVSALRRAWLGILMAFPLDWML
jgi:putative cardiolipin synthase